MPKSNLDYIHEALDAGLDLELYDDRGRKRLFSRGQITREVNQRGAVRTTHGQGDDGYVWLTKAGIRALAQQAKEKLANKDELLRQKAARVRAFYDR